MRPVVRWLMKPAGLLGILALPSMGCSQGSDRSNADVTTMWSSTAMAGPAAFVAEVRAMPFGSKDLVAASDLLRLGRVVCDGLGIPGLGFSRVVQRLVRSTAPEARALVRSAVRHLCPQHASAIG
jgi:Protein of unknown function (DUF732)